MQQPSSPAPKSPGQAFDKDLFKPNKLKQLVKPLPETTLSKINVALLATVNQLILLFLLL